jgi:hypothetical protein
LASTLSTVARASAVSISAGSMVVRDQTMLVKGRLPSMV